MAVEFKGTDELKAKLMENARLEAVKNVVRHYGASLQEKAIMKAPVDTGNLRRSINLSIKDDGMTAVIKADTDYAAYQEYGTRYMDAQPYMGPSKNEVEPLFIKDLKKVIN